MGPSLSRAEIRAGIARVTALVRAAAGRQTPPELDTKLPAQLLCSLMLHDGQRIAAPPLRDPIDMDEEDEERLHARGGVPPPFGLLGRVQFYDVDFTTQLSTFE